jgi:xanthine dehydrogenase FAD-binding subunit
MFPIEKYHMAESVQDAVRALAEDENARVIAGGTDVLIRLHEGHADYRNLVDINRLDELRRIWKEDDGSICIGALASFTEIMNSPLVREFVPVIGESVATVGGPQVRNRGTMGGNICNGAVSADSACAALVHEVDLVIQSPDGERVEPVLGFHAGPGRVNLKTGDLLTHFRIRPENHENMGASYYKYAMREAMDIATIGCAAGLRTKNGAIAELRLAYTVSAPTPIRCPEAEKTAAGQPLTTDTLDAIAQAVEQDVKPRTSWRATKEFRMHVIRTLAARVITEAAAKLGEQVA